MCSPETQGDEPEAQDSLFSCEDASAQASLQWLQDHSEQPSAAKLLAQISEWNDLLKASPAVPLGRSHTVTLNYTRVRQLARQHGISFARGCSSKSKMLESARSHFLEMTATVLDMAQRVFDPGLDPGLGLSH